MNISEISALILAIIFIAALAWLLLRKKEDKLTKPSFFETLQAERASKKNNEGNEQGAKRKLKKGGKRKEKETSLKKVKKYNKSLDVWE